LWYCDYPLGQIDHAEWKIKPVKNQPLAVEISQPKPKKVLPMFRLTHKGMDDKANADKPKGDPTPAKQRRPNATDLKTPI
jgi:hypothetical protein